MPYDPHRHHRHSLRLNGYDYSQPGAYFVTICARQHGPWFGTIAHRKLCPNDAALMVARIWEELPQRFGYITLDTYVVMPDHVHAIVHLVDGPASAPTARESNRPYGTLPGTIGRVVQAFKSLTTVAYVQGVHERRWPPFEQRLWHRNYHDRILRHEGALHAVRAYIAANPARWRGRTDAPDD